MKQAMPSNRASPRKNGHLDNFGAFRSFMGARCRTKPPELQARECGGWRGALVPGRSNVGKRRSADLQSALNDLKPGGPARKHGHPKPTASRRSGGTRKMRLPATGSEPFYSTIRARQPKQWGVRTCVIFNPAARGGKARRFRRHLDDIGAESTLKHTAAVGDARRLAAEAVSEGFDAIVAAGGDGTLNEVVNGIGDVPDGFERARLGVLPLDRKSTRL